MKLYSVCHIRGIFNVNLTRAHYDTNSTDRDKMTIIAQLRIVQVLDMFSTPRDIIGHFAIFEG